MSRLTSAARLPSLLALVVLGACSAPAQRPTGAAAGPTGTAPLTVDLAAFGTLQWLEGHWRGTRPDGTPFFERYRFADDSTLYTFTFPDSSGLTPSDSGVIVLRGGAVVSEQGGARWVVTELADGRVRFDPLADARHSLTWVRRSPDAWVSTLRWPPGADGRAREVVYPMRRLPP